MSTHIKMQIVHTKLEGTGSDMVAMKGVPWLTKKAMLTHSSIDNDTSSGLILLFMMMNWLLKIMPRPTTVPWKKIRLTRLADSKNAIDKQPMIIMLQARIIDYTSDMALQIL